MAGPIGLYGGTFDPIHFGHLRLATELAEAFRLDRVLFVPAGLPYHRGREAHATSDQRLTMLKLAIGRDARFDVDDRELRRPGETYTYDTLAAVRAERGPDLPLVFLTGSDAFSKVDTWHRWQELFDLAHFVVAIRANDEQWQAMLDMHATAPFRMLRAFFPVLKAQVERELERGERPRCRKVVNISSVSGTRGAATQIAYSAGKAAVVGITTATDSLVFSSATLPSPGVFCGAYSRTA